MRMQFSKCCIKIRISERKEIMQPINNIKKGSHFILRKNLIFKILAIIEIDIKMD